MYMYTCYSFCVFFSRTTQDGGAQIVIFPSNTNVREGYTVLLTCVAYGDPIPNLTWSKDGEELSNTSRISLFSSILEEGGLQYPQLTLEICASELEDAGTYTCTAANENGTDSSYLELTVERSS